MRSHALKLLVGLLHINTLSSTWLRMTEKEITGWGVDTSHKFLLIKHVRCLPKQPSAGSWPSSFSYLPCPNTQRVVVGAAAVTQKNNVHPRYLRRSWDGEALSTPLSPLPAVWAASLQSAGVCHCSALTQPPAPVGKMTVWVGGRRGTGVAVRRASRCVFGLNSSTIPGKCLLT